MNDTTYTDIILRQLVPKKLKGTPVIKQKTKITGKQYVTYTALHVSAQYSHHHNVYKCDNKKRR